MIYRQSCRELDSGCDPKDQALKPRAVLLIKRRTCTSGQPCDYDGALCLGNRGKAAHGPKCRPRTATITPLPCNRAATLPHFVTLKFGSFGRWKVDFELFNVPTGESFGNKTIYVSLNTLPPDESLLSVGLSVQ